MRFGTSVEQTTLAYSAGHPASVRIGARSSWIVGLLLELELAKTDAASPTTYQDWLYRAMTGLRLEGGKRPYLNIGSPDLRILYWHTRMRQAGRRRAPDMQAGAVTFRHQLPLLFTPMPIRSDDHLNYYDAIAGIEPDTDLTLTVNWGAAAALGANRTIGAGTLLRVTYLEAIPESPAEEPKFYPQWSSTTYAPAQAYTNQGGAISLDTGLYYRRSTVMILKGAAPADVRSDGTALDAVSEVAVRTSDNRSPHVFKTWDFSQLSQGQFTVADDNSAVPGAAAAYGAATAAVGYNPGVGQIDWSAGGDPGKVDALWGANLLTARDGALRIGFTVDNNANLSIVAMHEGWRRY